MEGSTAYETVAQCISYSQEYLIVRARAWMARAYHHSYSLAQALASQWLLWADTGVKFDGSIPSQPYKTSIH